MTKEEAKQHISNLSEHNANRNFLAKFKSTSLAIGKDYIDLLNLANEAKKVLGSHRYQKPYEYLIKEFPTMTKEYYDNKRKQEKIT
jgi:hypothetical protein